MPPDWLSWEFWARDSESLYRLALIVAAAIGIPLLYVRTVAANKAAKAAVAQAKTAEQGHITDRFTAAVEQLGSDKMTVRLGGIYALERIFKDSRRDNWTIMETLTAFVRERAPWPPWQAVSSEEPEERAEPTGMVIRPATDIQAALTVLGRREVRVYREELEGGRFDLATTDLRCADLRRAHLMRARLWGANLERASLEEAHLERADLSTAYLDRAGLRGAHLEGAALSGAHLTRTDLRETHLEGANLQGAHLEGVYLDEAVGLTKEQLAEAYGDENTIVQPGLRPDHWPPAASRQSDDLR